jgi:hypothetical protein
MSKAKKEGKPKRNRTNLVKKLNIIKSNQKIISKIIKEFKTPS